MGTVPVLKLEIESDGVIDLVELVGVTMRGTGAGLVALLVIVDVKAGHVGRRD